MGRLCHASLCPARAVPAAAQEERLPICRCFAAKVRPSNRGTNLHRLACQIALTCLPRSVRWSAVRGFPQTVRRWSGGHALHCWAGRVRPPLLRSAMLLRRAQTGAAAWRWPLLQYALDPAAQTRVLLQCVAELRVGGVAEDDECCLHVDHVHAMRRGAGGVRGAGKGL